MWGLKGTVLLDETGEYARSLGRRGAASEERRREEHGRERRCADGDVEPPVEPAASQEAVAERAAGEHAHHRTHTDHEQQDVRERLPDAVLLLRELGAERLHAGEEVVAESARGDEIDVRADAQDVARGRDDVHAAWIDPQHEIRTGLEPSL